MTYKPLARELWKFLAEDLGHIWSLLIDGSVGSRSRVGNQDLVRETVTELRDRTHTFLARAFPGVSINEEGISPWPPEDDCCCLDLVDATHTLLLGTPVFGIQFALIAANVVEHAVVFLPCEQRLVAGGLYFSVPKAGTFLQFDRSDPLPLRVSSTQHLSEASIAVDGPTKAIAQLYDHRIASSVARIRNFSSFCWAGTRLARGENLPVSLDAVIGIDNKPHDHIPSIALVQGAGGMVTGFGRPHSIADCRNVILSNRHLHPHISGVLEDLPSKSNDK